MRKRLILNVSDDHLDAIDEIAARAASVGFDVEGVLPILGMITGSAPDDREAVLKEIPGVASVEPEGEQSIPPPGSSPS